VIWWTFFNILEYGFQSLELKKFFASMEYFGIGAVPVAWLTAIAVFTDYQKWITRRNVLLLCIVPAITVLMIFTNDYHHLMRSSIALDTNGPFSVISKTYGPWFWLSVVHNDTIILIGVLLIFRRLFRPPKMQNRQLVILLLIAVVPWMGNLIYIFKLGLWSRIDLTSTFLAFSGVLMTFGLLRYHLFDVIHIGRELILEDMTDPILILDSMDRVVDYNKACKLLFQLGNKAIAQPVWKSLALLQEQLPDILDVGSYHHEVILHTTSGERAYDLRVDTLYNRRNVLRGRSFHFRDITKRKAAEQEREKVIVELREALDKVDTLSGFLPICSNCKKIRNDKGYWSEVEEYISQHSSAQFSHSLCIDCMKKMYPEQYERLKKKGKLDKFF